jgi:hypothetical protein
LGHLRPDDSLPVQRQHAAHFVEEPGVEKHRPVKPEHKDRIQEIATAMAASATSFSTELARSSLSL